jgi:hypothetical protein
VSCTLKKRESVLFKELPVFLGIDHVYAVHELSPLNRFFQNLSDGIDASYAKSVRSAAYYLNTFLAAV